MHTRNIIQLLLPKMDLLDTFIRFSELPAELRCIIWQISLPKERTVEIVLGRNRAVGTRGYPVTIRSISKKNPGTLFVNHKSRTETLRHYKLVLRPNSALREDTVYFDPTIDGVLVNLYKTKRELIMKSLQDEQ